jgi:hypothetical protein
MKAVGVFEFGGPEKLQVVDVARPEPRPAGFAVASSSTLQGPSRDQRVRKQGLRNLTENGDSS